MSEAIFWTIWGVGILLGLTGFIFGTTYFIGWFTPRYKQMEAGEGFKLKPPPYIIGYQPCCPPGLGCNDQKRASRCRRDLALSLANVEEAQTLDHYWSEFQKDSNPITLGAWESYRDSVIDAQVAERFRDVAEGGRERLQLMESSNENTVQTVKGEVEDTPRRKKHKLDPYHDKYNEDRW